MSDRQSEIRKCLIAKKSIRKVLIVNQKSERLRESGAVTDTGQLLTLLVSRGRRSPGVPSNLSFTHFIVSIRFQEVDQCGSSELLAIKSQSEHPLRNR